MASAENKERAVVVCEHCESIYPVYVLPDGDIRLIGAANCSCGNEEFRLLE